MPEMNTNRIIFFIGAVLVFGIAFIGVKYFLLGNPKSNNEEDKKPAEERMRDREDSKRIPMTIIAPKGMEQFNS